MIMESHRYKTLVSICFVMMLTNCSTQDEPEAITTIRIAPQIVKPNSKISEIYQDLFNLISADTGLKIEQVIPKSYEHALDLFKTKEVDLALFGGVSYINAHSYGNAEPLVMNNIDGYFRTVGIVPHNNLANQIQDLRGGTIAFGDYYSASGHFMPRYFMRQENIYPESFFASVRYTGKHTATAKLVQSGKVDLGFINSGVLKSMFLDKRLDEEQIKIIWISPPFNDYVWVIQSEISEHLKTKLRDSFMNLNHSEQGRKVLARLGLKYYIPASHNDFKNLESIVHQLNEREISP